MSKTKVIPSESQVLDALQLKLGCFKCIGQCGEMGICCFCFAGWFLCSFLSFFLLSFFVSFLLFFFASLCVSLLRFCFFLVFFVFFLCVFVCLFIYLFIYLVVVAVAVCGDGGGGGIFNMSRVEPIHTRTSKVVLSSWELRKMCHGTVSLEKGLQDLIKDWM